MDENEIQRNEVIKYARWLDNRKLCLLFEDILNDYEIEYFESHDSNIRPYEFIPLAIKQMLKNIH